MTQGLDLSVVIATSNRDHLLGDALAALAASCGGTGSSALRFGGTHRHDVTGIDRCHPW
jgi:hypothetical protein